MPLRTEINKFHENIIFVYNENHLCHTINLHADWIRMSNIEEAFNEQLPTYNVIILSKIRECVMYMCFECCVTTSWNVSNTNDSNQIQMKKVCQRYND